MGTLTKTEQAVSAKAAGANFLVSPICEPAPGEIDGGSSGLLTMAGALTPTEVFQAYSAWVRMWSRSSPVRWVDLPTSKPSKDPSRIFQ